MMHKNFLSPVLSIFILLATFHVDIHNKYFFKGYSLFNIDYVDENGEHHYLSNHCEKCLVKNTKSVFNYFTGSTFSFKTVLFNSLDDLHIDYCLMTFSSFSRPPPAYFG